MFQNLEARAMEFILMASAVAVDNQPGQEVYLGPMVNLTLNDETCPHRQRHAFMSEGFIEEQPRGDYIVIQNEYHGLWGCRHLEMAMAVARVGPDCVQLSERLSRLVDARGRSCDQSWNLSIVRNGVWMVVRRAYRDD